MSLNKIRKVKSPVALVLTSMIWGTTFVIQLIGGEAIGPFTFNCIRSFIGALALMPAILVLDRVGLSPKKPKTKNDYHSLLKAGLVCGIVLFLASNIQQVGVNMSNSAGKSGFITTLYILIVPILGLFFKRKSSWNVWISVAVALVGLYLLCFKGPLGFNAGDYVLLLNAFFFAVHILVVDRYAPVEDNIRLSFIQFIVSGILTIIPMITVELIPRGFFNWIAQFSSFKGWVALLLAGILASGVAYTLQIVGQNGMKPAAASLIMSFESVFAFIAAWIIRGEQMTPKEMLGGLLIFIAVVFAQIPFKEILVKKKKRSTV